MADSLYLSLWFPDFTGEEMFTHALAVMRQFPFSTRLPGITNVALHPVSWNEATILEQRFSPGIAPEEAVTYSAGLAHEDYAYVFEANWELRTPQARPAEATFDEWTRQPSAVTFIVRGEEFDERESETQGEIEVDFGIDTPFLHEELQLSQELESRVRANVQMLVEFIKRVETNSGSSARLLWSESEESLAQKLVSRLQKVQ
jgi:hypothetical protein